ncbi:MAG: sugar-binding protein, partial [Candidatus Hydrogenedentota bacterium]
MSIMEEITVSGSIGTPGTGPKFAGSKSLLAESQGILDFLDMNGDLFPDIVGPFVTQYTTMTGGLEQWGRVGIGRGFVRQSTNNAWNFGIGFGIEGNPAKSSQSAKGDVSPSSGRHSTASAGAAGKSKGSSSAGRRSSGGKQGSSGKQGSQMAELGFGGKLARGDSTVSHDLVDINGDGLPDLVLSRGFLNLMVALNLGYGFAFPEPWGNVIIDESNSSKYTLEGSLGYNDGIYGIGGGASYTRGDKWTKRTLVDINGDDLVDFVIPDSGGFLVALNTGAGFAAPVFWRGGCNNEIGASADITVGGGAFFTIGIGPLCKVGCYIIINPGGFVNFNMSRSETDFTDVNGDGLADHVFSDNDGQLDVALNQTGRTNLLKKVLRPMGATILLKYQRDGNTIDYPPSRWNLSRVELFDGHPGDGVDTQITTFDYSTPINEPNERESYGYRTVTEEHRDAGTTDTIYRTITRTYKNDNFYNKGLLETTVLQDAAGNKFIEEVNNYELIDIDTGAPIVFPDSTTATVFPQLVRSETFFYEGQPTAGKFTYATYRYDSLGNIIEFFDAGDPGAEDDLLATIGYFADLNNYIVGKPNSIVLSSNGIELRRCEATIETVTGAVRQVRRFLEDGQAAVTDLDYYPNGNLWSVTGPPNLH